MTPTPRQRFAMHVVMLQCLDWLGPKRPFVDDKEIHVFVQTPTRKAVLVFDAHHPSPKAHP
jgi:hypothetical protein